LPNRYKGWVSKFRASVFLEVKVSERAELDSEACSNARSKEETEREHGDKGFFKHNILNHKTQALRLILSSLCSSAVVSYYSLIQTKPETHEFVTYENCVGLLFNVAIFQAVFQKFLQTEMNSTIQYNVQRRERKA
jgi:hypothetical protein